VEVLSTLNTRQEIRKSTGLIKLVAGQVENRKVDIGASWAGAELDEDKQNDDDDDDGEETGTDDGEDENIGMDDVELEEDESEEDEEPVPAPAGKRKRLNKSIVSPARPNKKVSFAADPKESKRARAAAGAAKKATPPVIPKSKLVPSKLKASKVANVSTGKTSQKSTAPSNGGEEAYDFGKFF